MAIKFDKSTAIGTLSLTPLIDIVFLLLIFFLVATEFAKEEREMKVVLPAASEAKPLTAKPSELYVNILKDGTFIVNRQKVDVGQLEKVLRQASNTISYFLSTVASWSAPRALATWPQKTQ